MKLSSKLATRSSAAMALTLGLTTANFLPIATLSASAQSAPLRVAQSRPALFNRTVRIAAGAVIPTTYAKEKIILAPDESMAATLTIPSNIRSGDGRLLIPAGSTVEGEFRPTSITNRDGKEEKGTRFIARTLFLANGGGSMSLDASSDIITRKETISKGVNTTAILTGAAIGAGAGAIVSGVTGDRKIGFGNILIGAASGAVGGWLTNGQRKADVIVVNPTSDLGLRLATPLAFNNAF